MEQKYTREGIEELRKIRDESPDLLTSKEKGIANLKPAQKGEVRNPKGRGKGVKNWSAHFKKLMGDEKFLKTIIKSSPKEWDGIVGDYPADVIAAGVIAVITREVAKSVVEGKSLSNATLRSIELLNKTAYGEKVVHDIEEEGFFDKTNITFQVISPKETNGNNS